VIRTREVGTLRLSVVKVHGATFYEFSGPKHGRLSLLPHEVAYLVGLAQPASTTISRARQAELRRMATPAAKPLPFGRRKAVKA